MGEGGLDATARVIEHPGAAAEHAVQPLRRTVQIELDDFRRTRTDQKQQLDVRTTLEQAANHAIELVVGVGQTGEVAVVDDGCGEPWLGEDHHARRRLDQVGAGARTDHQEERILDLAVQPDDAGQAAKHLALTALAQHRRIGTAGVTRAEIDDRVHAATPKPSAAADDLPAPAFSRSPCSRAMRSFQMNCPALIR